MPEPLARSPIDPPSPHRIVAGWLVSARRSTASLRLVDCTPLAKVLVRVHLGRERLLDPDPGTALRRGDGSLVVRSGPTEALLLGPPGIATELAGSTSGAAVLDVTHALAAIRVGGPEAARLLSAVCPLELEAVPSGWAGVTGVEGVRTGIVRDDHEGERSYLLWCERSSGAYLFGVLSDAGAELGVETDGFRPPGI